MRLELRDFAAKYADMYEGELLELARDYNALTEAAQTAIGAELVRRGLRLPEPRTPEPRPVWNELITVARYRDLTEAQVAKSALESAGIRAQLFDDNLARMNWAVTNALGGIRLQVNLADREASEEILAQNVPQSIPFEDAQEFEQPNCPVCGSLNISFEGRSRKAAMISLYLLNVPLPTGHETWVCGDCGAKWEDPEISQ